MFSSPGVSHSESVLRATDRGTAIGAVLQNVAALRGTLAFRELPNGTVYYRTDMAHVRDPYDDDDDPRVRSGPPTVRVLGTPDISGISEAF